MRGRNSPYSTTPNGQKLIKPKEGEQTETIFQRVQIQISARATEKQIYQWLINIHQPEKVRILNYLKLSPPTDDSNLINCQIIADHYTKKE